MKTSVKISRTKSEPFVFKIIKTYLKDSTPSELRFDILTPIFLSLILAFTTLYFLPNPRQQLLLISEMNGVSITIISILAGFNTASLAIIASAHKETLLKEISPNSLVNDEVDLKDSFDEEPLGFFRKVVILLTNNSTDNKMRTLISFFSYAIISQLIIIVIGLSLAVIFSAISKSNTELLQTNIYVELLISQSFSVIWISMIFHAIFLSIRNADIIFQFILYSKK